MKKILQTLSVLTFTFIVGNSKAQLAGTFTVPGTYSTIAAAVSDINTQGVNGTVTILVNAGYTETAPAGGYSLTTTGTATSPIIFMKNGAGANPLITAYTGSNTPGSAFQDGVFRIIGSDYITFNGIDITDPNLTNPATMEFGYGFFKASASDGCQYNTVTNCVITLNRINNAFGSGPAGDGSRGIDVVNALTGAHTTNVSVSSPLGSNSFNTFSSNTIQNCNIGISMLGYTDFSPYANADQFNVIGGLLAANGNTIINYGGASPANYPADGVRTLAQYNLNVSYNTINSNNGSGVSHPNILRGIYANAAQGANTTINNNTVTLSSGGSSYIQSAIYNVSGSTANSNTVSINNNLIANSTYTGATFTTIYNIYNSGSPAVLSMSNNTFSNNSTAMTGGSYYNIYNSGAVTTSISINNNLVNLGNFSANSTSAYLYGVYNGSGSFSTIYSANSNTLQNANHSGTVTGYCYLMYNSGSQSLTSISSNNYNNLTINSSSYIYLAYNCATSPSVNIDNNFITGSLNKTILGGGFYGIYNGCGTTGTASISGNNFSNINLAGAFMYGVYSLASSVQSLAVSNNTISNITNGNSYSLYNMYLYYPKQVNGNLISNISNGSTMYGMYIPSTTQTLSVFQNTISSLTTTGTVIYGMYCAPSTTANIYKNKICDLSITYPFGTANLYGMYMGSGSYNNISNNYIGDLRAPYANAGMPITGLYINGGTTDNVYYNTIYLNATSNSGFFGSTALYASTGPNVNLRNNILVNLSVPMGGQYAVAYRRSANSLGTYSVTSNNNIFYAGTPSANNLLFYDGTNALQTIATYTTFVTPREINSKTENTPFLSVVPASTTFLHINPAAPSLAESGAVNIAGYTDDYDFDIRQGNPGYVGAGTAPDIGADEFNSNVVSCAAVTGGSISPNPAYKCINQSVTLNASGYSAGNGLTYQWQVSNTPGGPYSNVVGGNGQNYPMAYTSPTLALGNYYYVLLTTCTISGLSATSVEGTVSILGYPTLTVTPATATICVPGGGSVTLNATGANNYTWSPISGLNAAVGASVAALPAATTVYTVTGANLGGCASTQTALVNIATTPVVGSIVASPTLVCGGGSSSLQATGSVPGTYAVSNISFAPIPSAVSATTLCNAGTQVVPLSAGNLDDGGWYNISIPFNFNFFGTTYTACAISTNGFISLGGGTPYTYNGYGNTFPSAFAGHPCIGGIYADLDFQTAGVISTFSTGVAPNRKFIVNYNAGQYYFGAGSLTFQLIMYEGSNIIESHITSATGNNFSSEVIQNATGTVAYPVPGRNGAFFSVGVGSSDAYRWTPGPVTYSWIPNTYLNLDNISNPVASTVTSNIVYTVIITSTASGCTNTGTLSLAADVNPTVTITGTNAICSGSVINLTANGAATYSWSTGAATPTISQSPTVNLTYSVVGTSSTGCTAMATQPVTVYTTPTVAITGPSTLCTGQFANLTASGASTYSWSNGSTLMVIVPAPTVSTTYSVIGTNAVGSCTNVALKTISLVALPTVTITTPSTMCIGETRTLVASASGADTYSWSTGANSAVTPVSPTVTTIYTITVSSNVTGCSNTGTTSLIVNACVGIQTQSSPITGLSVYPNPNNGEFTIELNNNLSKTFEISDVTGRIVFKGSSVTERTNVNINNLANGIYYIKVQSADQFEVFKIVKQ
jgi:hypothetical protein